MCAGTVVIYVVSGPIAIVCGLYGCHTLFLVHHPPSAEFDTISSFHCCVFIAQYT